MESTTEDISVKVFKIEDTTTPKTSKAPDTEPNMSPIPLSNFFNVRTYGPRRARNIAGSHPLAMPILQALLETPQKLFTLVLTPARKLAFQIGEQFEVLGTSIAVLVAVIVGGIDTVTQALALLERPYIIVGIPGRFVDHLENTKGFNLRALK